LSQEEINDLMIDAQALAKALAKQLLVCPIDGSEWPTCGVKSAAKELRRHLVASH
jgi:hypothetical protein